ncbi:MAG: SDR family NAD(P)-dependent oxidoreductase, partial [bacterium]|nr:SDR family NAD(P)-dependent oxidoreductase [bacterium]
MTDTDSPAAMIDLTGRVMLVTGAGGGGGGESVGRIVGSGIGSGIVRRFAATGATVVAHTRNSPTDHLRYPDGTPVATVRADLTTPDGPPSVIEETLGLHGRLDGLVNNAGAQPIARFDTLTDQQFTDMMDINVTATHRLTQLAAAAMRRNSDPGGGSIVHIASIEARHPTVMHGHYA